MCGIAGIIQGDNKGYGIEQVKKMTTALAHRGPDGEHHWQNLNCDAIFGHRRLAIIDLSAAAAQPFHYMNRYTIIHNGEIYNYIELRAELSNKGYSFTTASDTEVITAAYAHWKENCVDHFEGMFAFAIWDESEKILFAARDRFGEKPFFYCYHDNTLVFGSEMKAIWAAGIEKSMNLQMLFNFITIGYTDNPERPEETFYNNIFKLSAASYLTFHPGKNELLVSSYWDIDNIDVNKKITDQEAIEQFRELFTASVTRRLRSDVSLGISLSGGLDSSSVLAAISEAGNIRNFSSYTAVFPGFEKDESAFAKKMASHFNHAHHTITVDAKDLARDWEQLCYHQEEPFGSASIYVQYKLYQFAASHGTKVLLDGQGADETLAGYHKYYKWFWQELFIKRKLIRSGELKSARKLGIKERFGARNIIASLFPDLASVILEKQYLLNALRQEDLTAEFVKEQSGEAYYTTPDYFNLNGVLYFNTCVHGLEELLRYADRNAMAHGREIRLPFLSHQLVEFVFSLPATFKIREGWTKWLLRKSMEPVLPAEITWRRDKTGFEPPQEQWMRTGLGDPVIEARKKLVREKILKPTAIEKPLRPMGSHDPNNYDWRYLAAAAFL